MRLICLVISVLLFSLSLPLEAQYLRRLTPLPKQLNEVSGMWIAAPDSIWWLNDGENLSELYLTNHKGKLIKTLPLPNLPNRDWEELTGDDQGNLYIGDFGNNRNKRRDLCIFKVQLATMQIDSIHFAYPDQSAFPPEDASLKDFDCESMVWFNGQLHLFTKMHYAAKEFTARYYTLKDSGRNQVATHLADIPMHMQVFTGATLSPDKKHLALVSYLFKKRKIGYFGKSYYHIYDWARLSQTHQVAKLRTKRIRGWITSRQVESIGYIRGNTLIIANERTVIHKAKFKRMRVRNLRSSTAR